jgi:hypothetical protein
VLLTVLHDSGLRINPARSIFTGAYGPFCEPGRIGGSLGKTYGGGVGGATALPAAWPQVSVVVPRPGKS